MQQQQQFMPYGWGMPPYLPLVPIIEDNDLFINSIVNGGVGPPGPPGPVGPPGPPGTPGLVPTTLVTETPFTPALTDYYLAVDVIGASSIVLPVAPIGTVFIVKDINGDADVFPITITATTPIDGNINAIIYVPYGSLTFIFNGTDWNIV